MTMEKALEGDFEVRNTRTLTVDFRNFAKPLDKTSKPVYVLSLASVLPT
jgi:hypothetical protein